MIILWVSCVAGGAVDMHDNVDVQLQVSSLNHLRSGTWLATHYIGLSIVKLMRSLSLVSVLFSDTEVFTTISLSQTFCNQNY